MTAILIVDDSQAVRTALAEVLEASGFGTITCGTLAEARTVLRTQPVSLALLDAELPDGSGVELLDLIRRDQVLGEMPVIVLADYAEIYEQLVARHITATAYLPKPYDSARLVAQVRQLLGAPPIPDLVLVIDGDPRFCGELVENLERAGFATRCAANAGEGLALAATISPAAILVDDALTDMDGPSIVRRLRLEPELRATPCLVLANTSAKETEVRALEAGADGAIKKDDLGVIVARAHALLRSHRVTLVATTKLTPKRILAIDDDADYLDMLSVRLRKRGYDVVQASSGEEAIRILDIQAVDCILLDRSMSGLGGVETCRLIKERPEMRDTPLIIVTAMEQRDAIIEGLSAGADDFVSKASGFDVLSARVQAQIRRKQIEDEQRRVRQALLRSELEAAEARTAHELAESRAVMAEQLAQTNAELAATNRGLEAFGYAVSHELRAPLRTISAFAQAIASELASKLAPRELEYARRVVAASTQMSDRIDALAELARIGTKPLVRHRVDLSALAESVVAELRRCDPEREADVSIATGLVAAGDARLIRILLESVLGKAWRATSEIAHIVLTVIPGEPPRFCVSHVASDAGLATAHRIVERHGGALWCEQRPDGGTQLFFTLPHA